MTYTHSFGFIVDWLVVFYSISTHVVYLISNPVHTYETNIYDL